jgi:putative alpha-1,2-mannosidase
LPQICPAADDDLNSCAFRIGDRQVGYEADSVVARPGYFAVQLNNSISAQAVVAARTAVFQFTYPSAAGQHPLVLLDLTDLWQSRQNASVRVDETSGRLVGNGTFLPSFGAGSYEMHFCVDFFGAQPYDSGVWVNNRAGTQPKELFVTRGFNNFYLEAGAFVRFQGLVNNTVTARVGLSFQSADQACRSAETEVPDPVGQFQSLRTAAEDSWRAKLSPVSVNPGGASEDIQRTFWSGMYRAMISPQNYTGENPRWDSGIPYFDSFYW